MRKLSSLLLAATFLTSVAAAPAFAQERDRWHDEHWHGDIRHFHELDFGYWRGGRWFHGFHGGHGGWWWIVGDVWYFYPAPVYPYPDPYLPPGVAAGPMPPPGAYTAAPEYAYYCAEPAGYYPYVPQCYAAWQRVPTSGAMMQPPPAAPPQMMPAPMTPPPAPAPQASMPMMPMPMPGGPGSGQREMDDRQLNALAVEFSQINPQAAHARTKLKSLETRIESFRQSLFQRNYNAMDILRDAESLEHRVEAQRTKIPAHGKVIMPAQPTVMTAPPSAAPFTPPPAQPPATFSPTPSAPPAFVPPPQQ